MAEWMEAPAVEELAKQLIEKYHGHLAHAKIKYLFRQGKWSSQDKTTWAKAYKVSERDNFLTGYDFYVIVNLDVWNELGQESRTALIDHELSHCGQNEKYEWCIWGHDVEDFAAVVRRHGLWNEDVKKYLQAAESYGEADQIKLFQNGKSKNISEDAEDDYSDLLQQMQEGIEKQNARRRVDWILNNSVSDTNYDSNIPPLTDDELLYCLRHEKRKGGLWKLGAEARRRGIQALVAEPAGKEGVV